MKTRLLLIFLCLCAHLMAGGTNDATLSSATYVLTLDIPSLPADERTLALVGDLKSSGGKFTFVTKEADAGLVTFSGNISHGDISLSLSAKERDHVITYHLSGLLTAKNQAQGDVSIFQADECVAKGTWMLKIK